MADRNAGSLPDSAGTFDYVIVGAGSAGCVLANRLTEDGNTTVCLIEAGQKATGLFPDMPMAILQTWQRPDLNWGFQSEPEPALNGRHFNIMRGKALGGTSQINGMQYMRGDRHDYDEWAASGATGWSYRDVLPYFRRAESCAGGETEFRGGSGPLSVRRSAVRSLRIETYLEAALAAGHKNSTSQDILDGFVPNELSICARGRRASTYRAYLRPAMSRRNLHVISGAHGRKLLLDGRRAMGFEFEQANTVRTVIARREVILSSGTFGSAQLLLLSGVGPGDALAQAGIAVAHDLPGVGRNLQEHPMAYLAFGASEGSFADELRLDRAMLSVARWLAFGTGPFACNGFAAQVFAKSIPDLDRPDLQLACMALDGTARIWLPLVQKPKHGFTAFVAGLRSDSRGNITLKSSDPRDPPRIFYNLLQEQSDMHRMIQGVREIRKLYAAGPLSRFVTSELVPGASCESDEQLADFLRASCYPGEHAVGTCRMGVDSAAVVDPQLKVHGLDGLRVVDASVMPTVTSGNTNAPVIMIAEKASDHIRMT